MNWKSWVLVLAGIFLGFIDGKSQVYNSANAVIIKGETAHIVQVTSDGEIIEIAKHPTDRIYLIGFFNEKQIKS